MLSQCYKCNPLKVEGCEWFTYYKNSKTCVSLSVCLEYDTKGCKGCTSGEKECQEYQCGLTGRCNGANEGIKMTKNTKDCRDLCKRTENCGWHSWDSSSKVCLLTADCPMVDSTVKTSKASEIGCDPNAKSNNNNNGSGAKPSKHLKTHSTWTFCRNLVFRMPD